MKFLDDYIVIESKNDYKDLDGVELDDNTMMCCYYNKVIHHNNKKRYPQYYKRKERSLQEEDYLPVSKKEFIEYVTEKINDANDELNYLTSLTNI